jgi:26S proteasome regulatory subunit N13
MTGQATTPSAPGKQYSILVHRSVAQYTTELSLTDVLTPQTLGPLIASNPELASTLFPFLPPDLPVPPSTDALQRVISSPQFRQAVSSLDRALRTGMLQDLVRGLGLPAEAGTGIEPFLRAIAEQARSQQGSGGQGSSMDTD